MIVSSFDVGPRNTSFALLSWLSPRATWLSGGPMDPNITAAALLTFFRDHNPDLVAIEWPDIGPRGAGKNILEARTVATKIRTAAEFAGIPVMTFTAATWRKAVLGRTKRTKTETIDRICTRVLTPQIVGMPVKLSGHTRDAAGVGLFAVRHGMQMRRTG